MATVLYQRLLEHLEAQARNRWQKIGKEELTEHDVNVCLNVAVVLYHLGRIAQEHRRFDEAWECYRRSLDIFEQIGDQQGQATNLLLLGRVAHLACKFDEAERWCRGSLAITERIRNPYAQAENWLLLGKIAQDCERHNEAADAMKGAYISAPALATSVAGQRL